MKKPGLLKRIFSFGRKSEPEEEVKPDVEPVEVDLREAEPAIATEGSADDQGLNKLTELASASEPEPEPICILCVRHLCIVAIGLMPSGWCETVL
ncbi:MAG: hypothetical protein AAF468_09955 [Pseudomonadota bacterium]